jgi:hypothetical protein
LTKEGALMGTPDYIAPEQMLDARNVDHRADLYSLGCTFYYLLTAQVPFPGGSMGEKLLKHQMHVPTSVEQLRPEVPPAVVAIVNRLMAKRPDERFQTAAELAAALESLRSVLLVAAPTAVATIAPAQDPNVLADWAAIAAASLGPTSRPGLGTPSSPSLIPPAPPVPAPETMAGKSSVVDSRVRRAVAAAAAPASAGNKRFLMIGLGIGAAVGFLLVALLLFLLPAKPADTANKKPPASSSRAMDEPRQPVFLADLAELDLQVWNKSFGKKGVNEAGKRLALKGEPVANALYVHPTENGKAQVVYKLEKKYKEFTAGVALADSAGAGSATPLTFVVSADGWVLWKSTPVQKTGEVQQCTAPVNDRSLLKLEVLCPGANANAHAVWIDPQVK